jgi:hypothetical protein
LLPYIAERAQLPITSRGVGEPSTGDHSLGSRIQNGCSVARLVRIDTDHHIVVHDIGLLARADDNIGEEGNATTSTANLS